MRSLGVDVGVRKGCNAVLLDRRRHVERRERGVTPDQLLTLLEREQPDVIAIDAPSSFAKAGVARTAERELSARGIRLFFTPTQDVARSNPFYEWMNVGMACFEAARAVGYRADRSLEVFPHASAVVIRGTLPPLRSSKARHRRDVLETVGVDTTSLRNLDDVDAALAALTGTIALEGGATHVGDPLEGTITLPTRRLLPRYARPNLWSPTQASAPTGVREAQPHRTPSTP